MPNTLAITPARGCSLQHRQGEHLGEHRAHSGHEHQRRGDLWQVDESEQGHGHAGEKGRACDEREWPLRPASQLVSSTPMNAPTPERSIERREARPSRAEEVVGDEHEADQGSAVDEVHGDDEQEWRGDLTGRGDRPNAGGQRRPLVLGVVILGLVGGRTLPAIPELRDRCERDAEDEGVDEHRGRRRSEDECCGSGRWSCDERERLEAGEDRIRRRELLLGHHVGIAAARHG